MGSITLPGKRLDDILACTTITIFSAILYVWLSGIHLFVLRNLFWFISELFQELITAPFKFNVGTANVCYVFSRCAIILNRHAAFQFVQIKIGMHLFTQSKSGIN